MSRKFVVVALPGGYAVARVMHDDTLLSIAEHASRDSAATQADMLEGTFLALARMEQTPARRAVESFVGGGRRLVRYFRNEREVNAW